MLSNAAILEDMCQLVVKFYDVKIGIKENFSSYNHFTDIYVKVYSKYAGE